MDGKFAWGGHEYRWWAGASNPDAAERYCVHVWREGVGITKYVDHEVLLVHDSTLDQLLVAQVGNHDQNWIAGARPLMAMDMWEHAFYLQFRNEKKKWVESFWNLIDWRTVESTLETES